MAPDLDPILGELVMDALCAVGLAATPKGWRSKRSATVSAHECS
jgi:hypothetical protein